MTVKELIEELLKFPMKQEVMFWAEGNGTEVSPSNVSVSVYQDPNNIRDYHEVVLISDL